MESDVLPNILEKRLKFNNKVNFVVVLIVDLAFDLGR